MILLPWAFACFETGHLREGEAPAEPQTIESILLLAAQQELRPRDVTSSAVLSAHIVWFLEFGS